MLTIQKSPISGKGVFTLKEIKRGARVFTFSNRIVTLHHRAGCDCHICRRCIQFGGNHWLYPYKNSYGWNLNHSCTPNCFRKGKSIYSLKKLKPFTEITIDYALTTDDRAWRMKCHCKSPRCRTTIRSSLAY
ncbi:MAG: hypothetical protein RL557_199 [archaeon]|jgi:SET domain-containing protein